ncbi:uncharacterized protein LOC143274008 [Peromyscus maniculatus bairdii]|uniref:uncharacterized protein LOC143274008 n=1 Tax=Peromyscus maniculatus bairdii TaxID=230844 RepID=UPI003FD6AD1E
MESGGERGPSARLPWLAGRPPHRRRRRRHPPDSVPSAAPSGRRREPPQSSRCGAQRPRRQLLLSHHLAVTASQKPPRLAAAGARDGRGRRPRLGGVQGKMGVGGDPGASRAGRAGLWAGRGDCEAKGLGWRRREAGRASRPHPPPAALNGPARTLGLRSGPAQVGPTFPRPALPPRRPAPPSPTCHPLAFGSRDFATSQVPREPGWPGRGTWEKSRRKVSAPTTSQGSPSELHCGWGWETTELKVEPAHLSLFFLSFFFFFFFLS